MWDYGLHPVLSMATLILIRSQIQDLKYLQGQVQWSSKLFDNFYRILIMLLGTWMKCLGPTTPVVVDFHQRNSDKNDFYKQ